jgi:hypothetical protein
MRIKTRNPSYKTMGQEYYVYEGNLVPTPKWIKYDAVCITGNESFRFHIIPTDTIIEMDDAVVDRKPAPKEKIIQVDNGKGMSYTVIIGTKNTTCDCAGFGFRKTCKHIAIAIAEAA